MVNENKGFSVIGVRYEDGLPIVLGRFKTELEKNEYLESIYKEDSGWTEEELQFVTVVNNYNYRLSH